MRTALQDFIGTILILAEIVLFIVLIGFAGAVDQYMISIGECVKKVCITGGAMFIIGFILYLVIRNDDRD